MRAVLRFLFSALGLLVASALVPGIRHGAFVDLLAVAVLLGALNASLGAFLRVLALVPLACSMGCFGLVINGLVFWLAGNLSGRLGLAFEVRGFWPGFFGALVSSLVAWGLERILVGPQAPPPPQEPRRLKIIN